MFNLFKSSFLELKKTKTIVMCGLLLGMAVVLNMNEITIGEITTISYSFMINAVVGFLFGPVPAGIVACLTDVLGHFIYPKGTYFFGFTLNGILEGMAYGFLLYNVCWPKNKLIFRVIACRLFVGFFVQLVLGSQWVSMLYGSNLLVLMQARFIKELIVFPIQVIVVFTIVKIINRYYYVLNMN